MSRPLIAAGDCEKRVIVVEENRMCDWFEPKRKTRYRVCCRNCKYFELKKLAENQKTDL